MEYTSWVDRIIPRTLDWVQLNPERALLLIATFVLLYAAIYMLLSTYQTRRQQLLRGSKMPKKARNKWVRRYTLDRWIASTERDIAVGKLTESEGTAMIRWLKETAGPQVFQDKLKTAKVEQELPVKQRLELLKKRIQRRVSFYGRMALFKPVKIPGPPVPRDQAKALEAPKRKKGEMFARKTKTA